LAFTTLVELYRRAFASLPRPDAFRHRVGERWRDVSSAEAQTLIERVAAALATRDVAKGERVVLLSENRLEWALADFGILTAGAVTVPIYPTLTALQARHILADCAARLAIVSSRAQLAKLSEVRAALPALEGVIAFDADAAGAEATAWSALLEEGKGAIARDPGLVARLGDAVTPADLATLIYTSGTTGPPKGVMLTHANLVSNVQDALLDFPISADDAVLSVLPLSHIFERMAGHFTMVSRGVSIAYAESVDTFARDLREVRPTIVMCVPRLFEKMYRRILDAAIAAPLLRRAIFFGARDVATAWARASTNGRRPSPWLHFQHALSDRLVFRTLRGRVGGRLRFFISGGAPLSPEIAEFFLGAGLPVLEGYGLTETSPVIAVNRMDRNKPGTVGPPIAHVEVRIADDGEILAKGPGVMKGYLNLPAETAAALDGGWFHTGDIGHLDADGHLVITDRKKDLIVTAGGKKVAPQPIENALKTLPWVAEAVLLGDGRPYVCALIVPNFQQLEAYARYKGIAFVTDRDLVHHPAVRDLFTRKIRAVTAGLARFEQIKRFTLLEQEFRQDTGDLTPTLKVRRRIIAEKYAPAIEAMYEGHETPQVEGEGG
jgi:long-chain acyl-CoA synthetase